MAILVCVTGLSMVGHAGRLEIDPAEINASLFFDGETVKVSGSVRRGLQVAVVCRGKPQKLELKRKGQVWGVLWMNVGEVSFEQVPALYLLSTSAPLSTLAAPAALRRLDLGYQAMEHKAGTDAGRVVLFREALRLKQEERLYAVGEGQVHLQESPGGTRFEARCQFPARAPVGEYEVQLFGFKKGQGELLGHRTLSLRQVKLARLISTMARTRGVFYGILVVVIAIITGLLTGLVFGLGSKAH